MSDMMTFPDTWEEFEKSYGFTDSEEVYTNGARLIPSFRVKQWLDHLLSEEPQKWIPCSERLPEKKDDILVTGKHNNALYVDTDEWTGSEFWVNRDSVIAWMPLPEPWKKGEVREKANMIVTSDGYTLYQRKNQIIIGLPQTWKTLGDSDFSIADRKPYLSTEQEVCLLTIVKEFLRGGQDT